jgi:hypothetical protein
MRLDSAEFEKLLKSFDASLIILEGTKLWSQFYFSQF